VRFLLDTQTLIWSQDDTGKLPTAATTALTDPADERLLSIVSVWEIEIKAALGKLRLSKSFRVWVQTAITDLVLTELPIALDHIERQLGLPFHHRDPLDRLLAAQSLSEGIGLISSDPIFDAYGVHRICT
jgi:PIN domain nuclease of toxin-antitoxin system